MTDLSTSDLDGPTRLAARPAPRLETPIVPANSISGRALIAVVAIMTFLAALTTGAVMLIRGAAGEWQSDVAREVTIQIRPAAGRDLDAMVAKAVDLSRNTPGVADVRAFSKEESARLLEPWLGSGLTLEELPVPRLVVVRLASGTSPDLAALRKALSEQVTGASLDDHRGWVAQMRAMATSAVAGGVGVLALMIAATMLSVTFATRGAIATNRPVIEVLHFVGATDGFISGHFQRHFLLLGLKGGVIGGAAAVVLFAILGLIGRFILGSATEASTLFGSFSLGAGGYAAMLFQVVLIAAVTTLTSRHTVNRTLETIG
ncbi:MAG TPA: ABC transporter permease [Pseudolabrys sp.]|nr:ABC transporter permease [Pseudolabrys sp.]